ncbi:MAG: arylsulfotransferase family protein [Planctomycetota bacterium]|nr:arylsulfotransferase family protein [Planctomycetota bacterium]
MARALPPLFLLVLIAAWIGISGRDRPQAWEPPPEAGGWVEGQEGLWALARNGQGAGIGSIGYAQGWEEAKDLLGVVTYEEGKAEEGGNLYSSGHAPAATLMDMRGETLHTWQLDYADIPDAPPLDDALQNTWRRVRLMDDGSLLAIYGGRGLVCVDRDSRLIWHLGERVHHDLALLPSGRVLTLGRRERLMERLNPREPVVDDELLWISADGQVEKRVSVLDALLQSRWASDLRALRPLAGDMLHVNTVEPILDPPPGAHPAFQAGRVLCCARNPDWLFVLDPQTGRVEWLARAGWRGPHDPRLLPSGRVLLFDNLGASNPRVGPASRVLEFDPLSASITWQWQADPPTGFFSLFCGAATRLGNGNTLITETGNGRAFELAPDGHIVWDFHSPHRAGVDGALVAGLFEVQRVAPESLKWMER